MLKQPRRQFLKNALTTLSGLFSLPAFQSAKAQSSYIPKYIPQHIIDTWYAHNAFLIMLGGAHKIIATVATKENCPWMFYFFPFLQQAKTLKNGALNLETLAELKPDLIILPLSEQPQESQLHSLGIPAVTLHFTNFSNLLACIDQTATLLGTEFATQIARLYHIEMMHIITENRQKKPLKIIHISHLSPLHVDGRETIIDEWINYSGGYNGATITGNKQPITKEQLLAWNPDIIIFAANASQDSDPITRFMEDEIFSSLNAVKNKKLYQNPSGVFLWDRYGPELLLQLRWITHIIKDSPNLEEIMIPHIIEFYKKFYRITLSSQEARAILNAQPPPLSIP